MEGRGGNGRGTKREGKESRIQLPYLPEYRSHRSKYLYRLKSVLKLIYILKTVGVHEVALQLYGLPWPHKIYISAAYFRILSSEV